MYSRESGRWFLGIDSSRLTVGKNKEEWESSRLRKKKKDRKKERKEIKMPFSLSLSLFFF